MTTFIHFYLGSGNGNEHHTDTCVLGSGKSVPITISMVLLMEFLMVLQSE